MENDLILIGFAIFVLALSFYLLYPSLVKLIKNPLRGIFNISVVLIVVYLVLRFFLQLAPMADCPKVEYSKGWLPRPICKVEAGVMVRND